MPILKVTRYEQTQNQCAVAACASVLNFYNSKMDYKKVCKIAYDIFTDSIDHDGLDSGEMGILFNKLGFQKVTIISSDVIHLDYSWNKLNKKKLIHILRKTSKNKKVTLPDTLKIFANFLSTKEDNSLSIDNDFSNHIKTSIKHKKPIVLSVNWNLMFKQPKYDIDGKITPLGECEKHAIVVYGYNDKDVYVADSNNAAYKKRFNGYKNGKYKVSWNVLMLAMSMEDIIIAENYNELV